MSRLRPGVINGDDLFAPTNGTAYLMVYHAVLDKDRLLHGKLHAHGESCAIGSFWDVNPKCALYDDFIDEVAAVNDSVPSATPRQRRRVVLTWLRWKLQQCGMPGFIVASRTPRATTRTRKAK